MDLVDLIAEKHFLGQEFLTWLWYKAEERGGAVSVPDRGEVEVYFEKHMLLEYGEGQDQEKVICRGLQTELREARAGLTLAKKPAQARLRLVWNDQEFGVTLVAATFEFRSVRLPKTVDQADEGKGQADLEARLLDRIGLFEQLCDLVLDLFRLFISIRTAPEWPQELARIRAWIGESAQEFARS